MIQRDRQTAIVFVNYHSDELIRSKLDALEADGFRVVVADNSETFGAGSHVPVVRPGGNVGFGAACNAAIRRVGETDVVILHNPDLEVGTDGLAELAQAVRRDPACGAVAPAVRTVGGIRESGFSYPSAIREFGVGLRKLAHTGPASRVTPRASMSVRSTMARRRFGSAACLALSLDAYARVGGFDDRFFLYGEDLDLWHRLGLAGFRCTFEDHVVVDHGGASGSPMSAARREVLRWFGIELFAQKYQPPWQRMRRVHRGLIHLIGDVQDPIVRLAHESWRGGDPPDVVLSRTRKLLR